jgi:RNA polymerase sigma-70 factor (ECF subfamily)
MARLRDIDDQSAWREFEGQYRELMVRFCQRRGLQRADAEDVVQRAMTGLAKNFSKFAYDPNRGRFRDYLFRCVRNSLSDWSRRQDSRVSSLDTQLIGKLSADAGPEELARWEEEWVSHHYRLAMTSVRSFFEPRSLEIFERAVKGATVSELALQFQMTEEAVRKIRQRIKARLEELIACQIREEDALGS